MDPERKSDLKRNFVKFVIGIILLSFSFVYVQNNPAEKISIFSGFQIIFQKVAVVFSNIIGENGELLKRKYSLEKYYKELIKSAENRKCVSIETTKKVIEEYERLKTEKLEDLEENLPFYSRSSYQHEVDIEKGCENQAFED